MVMCDNCPAVAGSDDEQGYTDAGGYVCPKCRAEKPEPYDLVGNIIALENGELDYDATVVLFQRLIDSGQIRALQGSYQRAAQRLIDSGECTARVA